MKSNAFSNQVALVTGSGRGIGAATAELLAERGARVFVCARTASEVEAVVAGIRSRRGESAAAGGVIDLARPSAPTELLDRAEAAFGAPARILVNNAAIGYAAGFLETAPERLREIWDEIQAVNARAPYLLAHEFMRRIARAKTTGSIVNLGSLGGIRGTEKFPGLSAYVASKFAVVGMTEALAVEGRAIGVRVNAVAPGAVDTEMLRRALPRLRTETKPADIAKVVAYLCDPAESGAANGSVLEIHSNLD